MELILLGRPDGYGSGYGYGYLDAEFILAAVISASDRAVELQAAGSLIGFWKCNADGTPANGGSTTIARAGLVEELPGPLVPCTKSALHGTHDPKSWKGERMWLAAFFPPVMIVDESKFASLKRELIEELPFVI